MSRKTNDSNKKQKKVQSEKVVDESIFKEVTINLKKMENDNKKKKSKKNKKKKNKFLKFILVALVITIITFVGLFIKRMNENGWTIGGFVATILGHDANTLANLSRINILVIGQSQNLTDTILVCSYDPKTQGAPSPFSGTPDTPHRFALLLPESLYASSTRSNIPFLYFSIKYCVEIFVLW